MARSLFDPDKAQGGRKPAAPDPERPLSVSDVAALIARALGDHLPATLRVVGELSNFNDRTHWYFRLKDDDAVLDCVMFASAARRVGFPPEDGLKVVLSGRVEHYAKQGRLQFYAQRMELLGAGELELRFRALCDEIRALGWFDEARKRPMPAFPRRVAVITSRTGAALQDVLDTMRRRCPAVQAALIDVHVQGESAALEIAKALGWVSRHHEQLGIDAIIVTRGGGSIEDLWAFNERVVARAIVESDVPVVAAIGHETDTTIAELVADLRCATPTQAAMRLTPDRDALAEQTSRLKNTMARSLRRRVEREAGRSQSAAHRLHHAGRQRINSRAIHLERLASRLAQRRPEAVLARRSAVIHEGRAHLIRAMRGYLERVDLGALARDLSRTWRDTLDRHTCALDALERELIVASPISVLARGFSLTTDSKGAPMRSVAQVRAGQELRTRLADGTFSSTVSDGGHSPDPKPPHPAAMPTRRRPRRGTDERQMDLF